MKVMYSCCHCLKGHPLQVRHKQDWGQGFILLLTQTAVLPGSDGGSDVVKPASSFVIQNCQTSCSNALPDVWGTLIEQGLQFVQWC